MAKKHSSKSGRSKKELRDVRKAVKQGTARKVNGILVDSSKYPKKK